MEFDTMSILYLLISIVVSVVVNSLFVWIAGRALVGKEKAKFTDAIWIVVIGAVLNAIMGVFNLGIVGSIVAFVVWLGLIKHFFDCGWGKALLIAIVAAIIQFILAFLMAIIFGVAIFALGI